MFPPEPVQPFVVKGLRLQCVDSPQKVTAGKSFDITAEVAKWSQQMSEYEIIDCGALKLTRSATGVARILAEGSTKVLIAGD